MNKMSWKSAVDVLALGAFTVLPPRVRTCLYRASGGSLRPDVRRLYDDYEGRMAMPVGLEIWRDRGFAPGFIVDCGAYKGEWSQLAHRLWPAARVAMVEPQVSKQQALKRIQANSNASIDLCSVLLGAEERENVAFFEAETGSSVLEELSDARRSHTTLPQTTLARLADRNQWPDIDLLKIDVQGYELELLRGAVPLLERVGSILVECSLVRMNRDAPRLDDVVTFLSSYGFDLVDFVGFNRRPVDRCTMQVDAFFLASGHPMKPEEAWR